MKTRHTKSLRSAAVAELEGGGLERPLGHGEVQTQCCKRPPYDAKTKQIKPKIDRYKE